MNATLAKRLSLVFVVLVVFTLVASGAAIATAHAQVGPNTPVGNSSSGNATSTGNMSAGNATGGGPLGGLVAGILPNGEQAQSMSNNVLETVAVAVLLAAAWTPIPENWDSAVSLVGDVNGLLWVCIALTLVMNLVSTASKGVDGNLSSRPLREWFISAMLGVYMFEILNLWLRMRRGIAYWFLQDVGQMNLETTLTATALIIVIVIFAIYNASLAVGVIVVSVGSALFIVFVSPLMGPLVVLRSATNEIISTLADALFKFYFLVTLITLPIVMGAGAAFTLDVGPQIATQLSTIPNADQFMTESVRTLLLLGAKVGSIAVGALGAQFVYSHLAAFTATPRPEVMVQNAAGNVNPREAAHNARARAGQAKGAGGEFYQGVRGREGSGGDAYTSGAAFRQTATGLREGSWGRGESGAARSKKTEGSSSSDSGGAIARRWRSADGRHDATEDTD